MKKSKKEVSWGIYEEDDGSYSLSEFYSGKSIIIPKKYQKKIREVKEQQDVLSDEIESLENSVEEIIKKLIK